MTCRDIPTFVIWMYYILKYLKWNTVSSVRCSSYSSMDICMLYTKCIKLRSGIDNHRETKNHTQNLDTQSEWRCKKGNSGHKCKRSTYERIQKTGNGFIVRQSPLVDIPVDNYYIFLVVWIRTSPLKYSLQIWWHSPLPHLDESPFHQKLFLLQTWLQHGEAECSQSCHSDCNHPREGTVWAVLSYHFLSHPQ